MSKLFATDVDVDDYDAAFAYLSLRMDVARARQAQARFKKAKLTMHRANDILRATDREPLPLHDPGVHRALLKALQGKKLAPVLLVSYKDGGDIADGYHRVSLAYAVDPFYEIPALLVEG